MRVSRLCWAFCQPMKRQITPEPITMEQFENYHLINSSTYSFLLGHKPACDTIYEHHPDTSSKLLNRNAIHIFSESTSYPAIQEKYNAHLKRLNQNYETAFEKCQHPSEIFHLERRIKSDVRNRCRLIGRVCGRFKHYPLFQSLDEMRAQRTLEEYKKKGVKVELLNGKKIYPQGPTWLPTSQEYLKLFNSYLTTCRETRPKNILDLGCGSGILSFLCGKSFKQAAIVAVDNNPSAVETCQINAASLELPRIQSLVADMTQGQKFQASLLTAGCPVKYDLIVSNPPWIVAGKKKGESALLSGVYDEGGKCIESSFTIANRSLRNRDSRLILIYSDLSSILGLAGKSVEELALENRLIIHDRKSMPYTKFLAKESPLNVFKQRAQIQLFEIGLI